MDFNGTKAAIRASILSTPPSQLLLHRAMRTCKTLKSEKSFPNLITERNTRILVAADRVMGELAEYSI